MARYSLQHCETMVATCCEIAAEPGKSQGERQYWNSRVKYWKAEADKLRDELLSRETK